MGSQATLQGADILVRDGRISELGPNLQAPADAIVVEAGGRPVTPGFFAGITALGLTEIPAEDSTNDSALATEAMRPEFDVSLAYNPNSTAVPVTRIEGYTWTLLGADRAGSIVGGQGRAVALDGGYASFLGNLVLFLDVGADASGQSGNSRAAEWMLLEQAISEAQSSEVAWSPAPLLTVAGRKALAAYLDGGVVVFNVDRASDILQVLAFSERHGLHAVISGGTEAWMVADRLAEAGAPVLVDALSNLPVDLDEVGARLDNAALLNRAGVTVAFTGSDTQHARKLRQAAGNAVANGLPWEAGLAALTVNPARIFDLGEGAGMLEVGGPADLVLWSGDPLEVTSVADQVMIGGELIEMVSRQTLLRDRYLPEHPSMPRAYIKPAEVMEQKP